VIRVRSKSIENDHVCYRRLAFSARFIVRSISSRGGVLRGIDGPERLTADRPTIFSKEKQDSNVKDPKLGTSEPRNGGRFFETGTRRGMGCARATTPEEGCLVAGRSLRLGLWLLKNVQPVFERPVMSLSYTSGRTRLSLRSCYRGLRCSPERSGSTCSRGSQPRLDPIDPRIQEPIQEPGKIARLDDDDDETDVSLIASRLPLRYPSIS